MGQGQERAEATMKIRRFIKKRRQRLHKKLNHPDPFVRTVWRVYVAVHGRSVQRGPA
jgi:hypothetical protein